MRIEITKGARDDAIRIAREDGSEAVTRFPKKGPVPHDAVHWFVERGLGLKDAFWGKIAAGIHPEELLEIAQVVFVAALPRNASGKLLKRELRLLDEQRADNTKPPTLE